MTPRPPLPDLERELLTAARRLDGHAPRRRWLRRTWATLSVVLVATGATVAAARVAHIGPFAYLSDIGAGLARDNPRLTVTSRISAQPTGEDPTWRAVAYETRSGNICLTGGPRDPRTTPPSSTRPTTPPETSPAPGSEPPSPGLLCIDSDEVANAHLASGGTGSSALYQADLDGTRGAATLCKRVPGGACVPDTPSVPPQRLLVMALREADAPEPVVRWNVDGKLSEPVAMTPSSEQLRLQLDRSPVGLDAREAALAETLPGHVELTLWAAEVKIPRGVRDPAIARSDDLPGAGASPSTVALMESSALSEAYRAARRRGWRPTRLLDRDPPPVERLSASQRRWVGAFTRPRTTSDAVPAGRRTQLATQQRFGFAVSRKLRIVGGGLEDVWAAPGGSSSDFVPPKLELLCFIGAPVLQNCISGVERWKRPFAEAVLCTERRGKIAPLPGGGTLAWALAPRGAERVELRGPGDAVAEFPAGDMVAVRRPRDEQIRTVVWIDANGRRTPVRVPWPEQATDCSRSSPGLVTRRSNNGSSASW